MQQIHSLLLNGADVNGCDYELRTPLHVAGKTKTDPNYFAITYIFLFVQLPLAT